MKRFIRLIRKIPILGALGSVMTRRFEHARGGPEGWIMKCFRSPDAQIVQIGSNDGIQMDPMRPLLMHNTRWRALLVEPLPHLFASLMESYGTNPRFKFANLAVTEGDDAEMFYIDDVDIDVTPDLPSWANMLGSFSKEHIVKHLSSGLESLIKSRRVPGARLEALLRSHDIDRVDILHIDTEGYDWHILRQLNLDCHQPAVILYEHCHLGPAQQEEALAFLQGCYDCYDLTHDTLAVHRHDPRVSKLALFPLLPRRYDRRK